MNANTNLLEQRPKTGQAAVSEQQGRRGRQLALLLLGWLILAAWALAARSPTTPLSPASEARLVWLEGKGTSPGLHWLPLRTGNRLAGHPLRDGAGLRLTGLGAATPIPAPAWLAPFLFQPVDINRADIATLTMVKGIGPALAGRILALRRQRGRLRHPGELLAVRGIGPATLKRLAPQLRFP